MRKLQIEDVEMILSAKQKEIESTEESRPSFARVASRDRRPIVPRGADLFVEDGTTVQRCVRRFEEGGFDAPLEGKVFSGGAAPANPWDIPRSQSRRSSLLSRETPGDIGSHL